MVVEGGKKKKKVFTTKKKNKHKHIKEKLATLRVSYLNIKFIFSIILLMELEKLPETEKSVPIVVKVYLWQNIWIDYIVVNVI